jgi:hypothetical protein
MSLLLSTLLASSMMMAHPRSPLPLKTNANEPSDPFLRSLVGLSYHPPQVNRNRAILARLCCLGLYDKGKPMTKHQRHMAIVRSLMLAAQGRNDRADMLKWAKRLADLRK